MLVKPKERYPLAVLLNFLEMGERLAHDCAHAQATLAPDERMGTFLRGQAKQEAFHARLFRKTADWMAPTHGKSCESFSPLQNYRRLIDQALERKDFFETVLAEQIILESLGEVILRKLDAGLKRRRGPFTRIRRILIQQEASHHGFGERVLEQAFVQEVASPSTLRDKASPYLELSRSFILVLQSPLEDIDENPQDYVQAHQALLPTWLGWKPSAPPHKEAGQVLNIQATGVNRDPSLPGRFMIQQDVFTPNQP